MKKIFSLTVISMILGLVSCDDESNDWSDLSYSAIQYKIAYSPNPADQYSAYLGEKQLGGGSIVPDNDLNGIVSVWYKTSPTDSVKVYNKQQSVERASTLNFIQLSETSPMELFEFPAAPDTDSKTKVQLFYDTATQPDAIKVKVLAVDRYQFQVKAQSNFNSPNLTLKEVVAEFTLNKNELSQPLDLNLNQFNGGTNNYEAQFYYQIENAITGTVIQAYNKNVKISVDAQGSTASTRFKAKYQYTLPKFGTSGTYPFNTPEMLINQTW